MSNKKAAAARRPPLALPSVSSSASQAYDSSDEEQIATATLSSQPPATGATGARSSGRPLAVAAASLLGGSQSQPVQPRPVGDLTRAFQSHMHTATLTLRQQLKNTSMGMIDRPSMHQGGAGDSKALICHSWKPVELDAGAGQCSPAPVVVVINGPLNTYRTIADVPLFYKSEQRLLHEPDGQRKLCSLSLESIAVWTAHPRVPYRGNAKANPPVYGVREYASRSGPRLPWTDDIIGGAGDLSEIMNQSFLESDITGRTQAALMITTALNIFCQFLREITLPSVVDVIYAGSTSSLLGHGTPMAREAIEQMVNRAPLEDFADYTAELSAMVIQELETIKTRVSDVALIGSPNAHLTARVATVTSQLIGRLILHYVQLRYSGVAIVYDGIESLCGYLTCPEKVAYSALIPRLATSAQYALDHEELYGFRVASMRNEDQRPVLKPEAPLCYQTCYAILRMRSDPFIAEGLSSMRPGADGALHTTAGMVHALYVALCWRWFCVAMIFPMFNISEYRHANQTPLLNPFGSRQLSSNQSNSNTAHLTPHQIVALYGDSFSALAPAGRVEITLDGVSLGDAPRVINYSQRAIAKSAVSNASGLANGRACSDDEDSDGDARASSLSNKTAVLPTAAAIGEDSESDPDATQTPPDYAPRSSGSSLAPFDFVAANKLRPAVASASAFSDDDEDDDDLVLPAVVSTASKSSSSNGAGSDKAQPAATVPLKDSGRKRPLEGMKLARKRTAESADVVAGSTRGRYNVKDRIRRRQQTLIKYAEKIASGKKRPCGSKGTSASSDYRNYVSVINRTWSATCMKEGLLYIVPSVTNPSAMGKTRGGTRGTRVEKKSLSVLPDLLIVPEHEAMPAQVIDDQRTALGKSEWVIDGERAESAAALVRLINMHTVYDEAALGAAEPPPSARAKNQRNVDRFNLTAVLAIHFYWSNWCQAELPRLTICKDSRHKLITAATKMLGLRDARCQLFAFKRNSPYFALAKQLDPVSFRAADCFTKMATPYLHDV